MPVNSFNDRSNGLWLKSHYTTDKRNWIVNNNFLIRLSAHPEYIAHHLGHRQHSPGAQVRNSNLRVVIPGPMNNSVLQPNDELSYNDVSHVSYIAMKNWAFRFLEFHWNISLQFGLSIVLTMCSIGNNRHLILLLLRCKRPASPVYRILHWAHSELRTFPSVRM